MNFDFSMYECILAILFFLISIVVFNGKNLKIILVISVFFLSILAFNFNPIKAYENGNYTDLFRYFYDITLLENGNGFESNKLLTDYNSIPIIKFVISIIVKIGIKNILPMLSALVYYGFFSFIVLKLRKDNIEESTIKKSFIIAILLSNFQVIITNIRIPVGAMLIALSMYYDFIKNDHNKAFILYIITIGIHPFFILIFSLRLVYGIIDKKINTVNNKILTIIVCIIILFYYSFLNVFINLLSQFTEIEYFSLILNKIDFYINKSANKYIDTYNIILNCLKIFSIFIYIIFIERDKKISTKFIKLLDFIKILMIFILGSSLNLTIFDRCGYLTPLLLVLCFIIYNNAKKIDKGKNIILFPNLICYFVVFLQIILLFGGYQYQVLCF